MTADDKSTYVKKKRQKHKNTIQEKQQCLESQTVSFFFLRLMEWNLFFSLLPGLPRDKIYQIQSSKLKAKLSSSLRSPKESTYFLLFLQLSEICNTIFEVL